MRTGTPSAKLFTRELMVQWEAMYCQCKELHHAGTSKTSNASKKHKVFWALKGAKVKGIDVHHLGHGKKIPTRSQVRLELWTILLRSPSAALAKAWECLQQSESAPSVTSE